MNLKTCSNCAAEIPAKSTACPECGASKETGWSDDAYSGLDLPDDEFDYDDFVSKEFADKGPKPRGINWFWWLVAITVLIIFFVLLLVH